jgi:hypothetical protein
MNISFAICATLIFCIDNCVTYTFAKTNSKLSIKQKAHVLSIKSSLTMFLLGLFFAYNHFFSYETSNTLGEISILCFTAYLISDISVGHNEYHKHLCSLAGYAHHLIYICINVLSIVTGNGSLYLLYMVEELPTLLLSLGRYNSKYRNDTLFGATFLLTRIIFHLCLTYTLRSNTIVLYFALSVFPLHAYWFYRWVLMYNNKIK